MQRLTATLLGATSRSRAYSFRPNRGLHLRGKTTDFDAQTKSFSLTQWHATRTPVGRGEDVSLNGQVPVRSGLEFRALANEGKATLKDAQLFLQTSKTAFESLPLLRRREAAAELGASHILLWLWDQPQDDPNYPREFADLLCWFIHAEAHEEHIWQWLETSARTYKSTQAYQVARESGTWGNPMRWAHYFLAGIMEAHLAWAADHTANSALEQFQRACKTFGGDLQKTVTFIGAIVTLSRALRDDRAQPCDATLFESFVFMSNIFAAHPKTRGREAALLQIFHPVKADPIPLLKLMQTDYQDPDNRAIRAVRDKKP